MKVQVPIGLKRGPQRHFDRENEYETPSGKHILMKFLQILVRRGGVLQTVRAKNVLEDVARNVLPPLDDDAVALAQFIPGKLTEVKADTIREGG
jgi:hypothetical protein